jgi:hypothetical protein
MTPTPPEATEQSGLTDLPSRADSNPRQRRRTLLVLDLERTQALFGRAVGAGRPDRIEPRRQELLGLLQAFADAGRPAGGVRVDDTGRIVDLNAILRAGERLASEGAGAERLWSKLRRKQAMDQRMAMAVLQFFRHVLKQPELDLTHLGAVTGERQTHLDRLAQAARAAREDLPADTLQSFLRRAQEAGEHAVALAEYRRRYEAMRSVPGADGVMRTHLTQVNRYRPVRLVPFGAHHPLQLAAEWYQFGRTPRAELTIRRLSPASEPGVVRQVPLIKEMRDGLVLTRPDPALAPDLVAGLPLADSAGRDLCWEVCWRLEMVFNAADRDILVNYAPLVRPEIEVEADSLTAFDFAVGDSPGLQRTSAGWRLDRTLLPREVLAIRLRNRSLAEHDAPTLTPTGEWRPSPQRPVRPLKTRVRRR